MINGSQTWNSNLSAQQKQPLYLLQIPQFGIALASYSLSQILPPSGWGVIAWGIGLWGT